MSDTGTESAHAQTRHLDPFCLPSETDSRFLLLVLTIAGTTLGLGALVLVAVTKTESTLLEFAGGLGLILFVFGWAWLSARRQATRQIERNQLESFPPTKVPPNEGAAVGQMTEYIHRTVQLLPELEDTPIQFVWDQKSLEVGGVAFGFAKSPYVCLRQGLLIQFITHKIEALRAVLLHELAHVANRDVTKTTFSIQLGKCFYWTAFAMLSIVDVMLVRQLVATWAAGESWAEISDIIRLVVTINIKSLITVFLVEVIRGSILRVREYYADARASIWMGRVTPLVTLLRSVNRRAPVPTSARKPWTSLWQQFRTHLVPLHPTNEDRCAALTDRKWLFRPSRQVAFFAGLLTGLSLNGNLLAFTAFVDLLDLIPRYTEQHLENSGDQGLLLLAVFLMGLASLLMFLGAMVVCLVFAVIPLAGTLGVQVQRAAIADKVRPSTKLLSSSKVVGLACIAGAGAMLGFWLTPIDNALSLTGRARWMTPVYLLGWSIVLAIWLAFLGRLSSRFLGEHKGPRFPKRKRRLLSLVSAGALIPLLLVMALTQALLTPLILGFADLDPANENAPALVRGVLVTVWLILPCLALGAWGLGWLRLLWLDKKTANQPGTDWAWVPQAAPRPMPPSQPRIQVPSLPPPL
jgi:Zn-dependent protease with chaperone function